MIQKPVNINVVVRCRPLTRNENARPNNLIKLHEGNLIEIMPRQQNQYPRVYQFDKIFWPETNQQDFYNSAVSPLLKDFLEGYNCSIFAYG